MSDIPNLQHQMNFNGHPLVFTSGEWSAQPSFNNSLANHPSSSSSSHNLFFHHSPLISSLNQHPRIVGDSELLFQNPSNQIEKSEQYEAAKPAWISMASPQDATLLNRDASRILTDALPVKQFRVQEGAIHGDSWQQKPDVEENSCLSANHTSASNKPGKRLRRPRYAFQTRSQVDILDDGYRWRKYGQKSVKNNIYPRSYYRCTYHTCTVKKQVQRLAKDPGIVVTTYEGIHMHPCERSSESFEKILSQNAFYF